MEKALRLHGRSAPRAGALLALTLMVPNAGAAQSHAHDAPKNAAATAATRPAVEAHATHGAWRLFFDGNAFLTYTDAGSDRAGGSQGARGQFGSTNWFMGMAERSAGGGSLQVRAALSLEPLTIGQCGYPDLLATGQMCGGKPLHDRQHPHDLIVELAAEYRRLITSSIGVSLYGGPAGEPALGPAAYSHRLSAAADPVAPISHHHQDATHVSFGVVTAGVFGRGWTLEGSLFNGREPDQRRHDLDLAPLDSYAARVALLLTDDLALQFSMGRLSEAEPAHHGVGLQDITRATASVSYERAVGAAGGWASTIAWGQNREAHHNTHALLAEARLDLDGRNIISSRAEVVEKSGDELALQDHAFDDRIFTVGKTTIGYTRQFIAGPLLSGIGGQLAMSFVPAELARFYGARLPIGFTVFTSVRPRTVRVHDHALSAPPSPPEPHE